MNVVIIGPAYPLRGGLATYNERLARAYAPLLRLEIRNAPIPMPIMREMIQYHTARATDAGLIWFRQRLMAAARGT